MTLRFLLDTNVLSEPLKPQPNSAVLSELDLHAEHVATASIVWHELLYGVAALPKGKRRSLGVATDPEMIHFHRDHRGPEDHPVVSRRFSARADSARAAQG